jgi:hypothetical protein
MARLLTFALAAALMATIVSMRDARSAGQPQTITSPDTMGDTGWFTSLELDASGNPVVSYGRADTADLKVLHCGNPSCTAGNVIASPDTVGSVGSQTSIELDAAGNPVVSYWRDDTGDLKVLHCGNPNCTSGNIIASPDTTGDVGVFTSLKLNAAGNPVVSYYRFDTGDLKVLHCGNAFCTAGNIIASPDTAGDTGRTTSLELDANGRPVVSYSRPDTGDLKVMHCGNPFCTSGNTIVAPDTAGNTGTDTSLDLDANGNPVVSYHNYSDPGRDLKILHCGNPNCTSGNVITTPDTAGSVGSWTSLELDANGFPVVSYYRYDTFDLKLLRCGNANCSSGNMVTSPDNAGDVGNHDSLVLDAMGNPVISYHHSGIPDDLKVLHCNSPTCDGVKPVTPTPSNTPTVTPSPTPSPSPTPKNLAGDTDGDTIANDTDDNDDNDGCNDAQETGPDVTAGGRRDPHNFWDFFDVPAGAGLTRDGSISAADFFAVLGRFNSSGDPGIDPLSMPGPAPEYHSAYDRGVVVGENPWNLGAANGSISGLDIFSMLQQLNHSCA